MRMGETLRIFSLTDSACELYRCTRRIIKGIYNKLQDDKSTMARRAFCVFFVRAKNATMLPLHCTAAKQGIAARHFIINKGCVVFINLKNYNV